MSPLPTLDGARILVTGASSGIGAALAPMLAQRGAAVGVVARRTERLAAVLADCERYGPGHQRWTADLSDPARAAELVLEAWTRFGPLDAVVNNAAIPKRRRVQDLTNAEVETVMRTNLLSPVALSLAVLPRMLERDAGVIVNVSSLGGRLGIPGEAAYCASKFALCGWSESMAADLWDTGVDVRLIVPGAIDTEIWDQPGNDAPLYDGPLEPPETVAAAITDSLVTDGVERYVPDLVAVAEFKTANLDTFLAGAVDMGRTRNEGGAR